MPQTIKHSTRSRIVSVADLSESDRDRMYGILCEHFSNVEKDVFEKDLSEKDWVVRVENVDGKIQGFSTLQRMSLPHNGHTVHAFFSGDTVLTQDVMGDATWIPVWTQHVFNEAAKLAPEKTYWLLLTATHKTYRILPSCFHEFFPRPEVAPNPDIKNLMGKFVRLKFPADFREESGLVVLSNPIPYRHAGAVELESEASEHHMATRYFKQINPNFLRGDFLCCFTEINPKNLNALGTRILRSNSHRGTTAAG